MAIVWKVNSDAKIFNFQPHAWQLRFCVSQWAFGKDIGEQEHAARGISHTAQDK